ncbi:MAG: amidohydrolase family protein [Planctomycetes bacterium]|nr:amidohydrolase family protein [Planctomycetota bacterium]
MSRASTRRGFLHRWSVLAGAAVLTAIAGCKAPRDAGPFDLLLRGGTIVDGTGAAAFVGDLGVRGDRIVALGDLAGATAARELDVRGLIVAPGFVDAHAHSDLRRNARGQSKVFQGVTMDVVGPDGGSPFPERVAEDGEGASSSRACPDFDTWAAQHGPIALDVGAYVGHGTVRNAVLGPVGRAATAEELARMQQLVQQAFEQGALGLSSGLEYFPGNMTATEELIALCKVAARFDRPYVTHIRNEDDQLLEAIDEAIRIARESGAPLLISHLKVGGAPNWHKLEPMLTKIAAARQEGLDVHCDAYPYEAWSTGLATNFPGWAKDGGRFVARLQDPAERARMRDETEQAVAANGGWGTLMLGGGLSGQDRALLGRRVDEVAKERSVEPFELACELLTRGSVSILGFGISPDDMDRIIAQPWCMIASDGSAVPAGGRGSHPRSFGAFPRAFRRYVRELQVMSIEAMVHKMTGMPAAVLRLTDRGVLAEGKLANVVVFDADRFTDNATWLEPQRYAEGVRYLLVHGVLAVDDGQQTEAMAGRVVRRDR